SQWQVGEPLPWIDVDKNDPQRADLKIRPQLYNLDCAPYESLLLGFFTIWRGQPGDRHKPNFWLLGYSRDGWHWFRPDRRPFCDITDKTGDWNATMCSPRAAAVSSSATSFTSTSAAAPARWAAMTPAFAAPAWPCCGATASPPWTRASRQASSPRGRSSSKVS